MKLVNSRNRINELMSRFVVQVQGEAAMGKTDLNKAAETILIPLLNEVYGWSLENINYAEDNNNYPGIDLADKIAGISIQVTATPDPEKVKHTLEQFIKYNHYLKYNRLIIFILKEKQRSYPKQAIQRIVQDRFDFDSQRDIWDYRDILKEVSNFQIDKALRVQGILEANFGEDRQLVEKTLLHTSKDTFGKRIHLPNLPSHFLNRAEELDELKKLVLSSTIQSVGVTGTAPKIGMYGMGGIGKSVMAAMLARDEELQIAFPDGVFWIVLGQEQILTLRQLDLARMLGDTSPAFQDIQQGKHYLRQLLENRRCLLILDDIWDINQVAAFNVLSDRGKLLFTTRDSSIVKALSAAEYQVALLKDDKALELLAVCSGQCKESLPPEAHQVVKECGNLPLALSMIGAIARARPNRWANLLYKLQNADLDKIRFQFPDYPYPDLLKAIQVSVDALEPEERIRYLDFAVFREDVPISETTLQTFWEPEGLDEYDTQDIIDVLVERSLAQRDGSENLILHDLQYDYLRKQITDFPRLHNRLLDAYATHCSEGWHTFSRSDGYFFEQLTYHLKASKRQDELYKLLVASPAWMEAKLLACKGHESYLADIEQALEDFTDPLQPDQIVTLIQLHTAKRVVIHYLDYYSDIDLKTLVWLDRETEALSHARLNSPFTGRLEIYKVLKERGQVEYKLIDEALEILESISDYEKRIAMLCQLIPILVEIGRADEANAFLVEVETFVWEAEDDENGELDPRLSSLGVVFAQIERFDEARYILEQIEYEGCQADVFTALAKASAKNGYVETALSYFEQALDAVIAASSCESNYEEWVSILVLMAKTLATFGYFVDAEEFIRLQEDSLIEALGFIELALVNNRFDRHEECDSLFSEVLGTISKIEVNVHRSWVLSELALALAKVGRKLEANEKLTKAIEALSIKDDYDVAEWRRKLAVSLAKVGLQAEARAVFHKAEESARRLEEKRRQSILLRNIAVSLVQSGYKEKAHLILADELEISQSINNIDEHGWIMARLAQAFAESGYEEDAINIVTRIREILTAIKDQSEKGRPSEQLITALIQASYFSEAQELIQMNDKPGKSTLFIKLVKAMIDANKLEEAEKVVQSIDENWCREWASRYLVSGLGRAGQIEKAQEVIQTLGRDLDKLRAMQELSIGLACARSFAKAEEVINSIESDVYRAELFQLEALIELAAALAQNGFSEEADAKFEAAILVASTIEDSSFEQEILKKLALALGKAKRFSQALCTWVSTSERSLHEVDDFLLTLMELVETFEQVKPNLSRDILREGIRIAGWAHPSWQEIYELFQAQETNYEVTST